MNDIITTGAIYIGTYITTKYVVNYAVNKATEKVVEGTWNLSKKAAHAAIDHLIKRENEEKCEYLDYELIEIDPVDRSLVRVINVIEVPPLEEDVKEVKPEETTEMFNKKVVFMSESEYNEQQGPILVEQQEISKLE